MHANLFRCEGVAVDREFGGVELAVSFLTFYHYPSRTTMSDSTKSDSDGEDNALAQATSKLNLAGTAPTFGPAPPPTSTNPPPFFGPSPPQQPTFDFSALSLLSPHEPQPLTPVSILVNWSVASGSRRTADFVKLGNRGSAHDPRWECEVRITDEDGRIDNRFVAGRQRWKESKHA